MLRELTFLDKLGVGGEFTIVKVKSFFEGTVHTVAKTIGN
jgi:hypothetical protein